VHVPMDAPPHVHDLLETLLDFVGNCMNRIQPAARSFITMRRLLGALFAPRCDVRRRIRTRSSSSQRASVRAAR
jgi:hypothetical protein